jgi:hypothetical protein
MSDDIITRPTADPDHDPQVELRQKLRDAIAKRDNERKKLTALEQGAKRCSIQSASRSIASASADGSAS